MNKKPVSLTRRQLPIDVWQSKDCRELLLVVYQAGRVAEIHWNSPSYKTANGISISSTFTEVAGKFPDGKALEYAVFETGKNRVDWDVPQHGIVFSMAGDQDGPMVRMAIYQPRSSKLIGYSQGDAWYWNPECSSEGRP